MITLFAVNLLLIWGLHYAFDIGNIFGFVKDVYYRKFMVDESKIATWIEKPLFGCKMCMSSVWSVPVYTWGVVNWDWAWWYWPVWVLCLTGASYVLSGRN